MTQARRRESDVLLTRVERRYEEEKITQFDVHAFVGFGNAAVATCQPNSEWPILPNAIFFGKSGGFRAGVVRFAKGPGTVARFQERFDTVQPLEDGLQ